MAKARYQAAWGAHMSAREAILGKVRNALAANGTASERLQVVKERLETAPKGIIPARGKLKPAKRIALFRSMAEQVSCTVRQVKKRDNVPRAVMEYLRSKNLPAAMRMGDDRRLARLPWADYHTLDIKTGPSDGDDLTAIAYATGGIAETGTVMLQSGSDNPTTNNFLPEHHIVVIDAKDIAGDLETLYARLRRKFGRGGMPRVVNLITGPSRSGDVEQKIVLGAHGPRALHIIIVDG